ncbi:MAG: ABC transporter substrate-binding protein [Spirochaetia bacterium]
MNSMKKLGFLVLALMMVGTLAFAGGQGEEGEAAEADQEEPIKVGIVVHGEPPVRYYVDGDPEKGLTGYEVKIIENVAECMGVEIEFYDVSWSGLFAGLLSEKWDWAASSVFMTEERAERMAFSNPYQESDIAFLKPTDTELDSFEDLEGKVLGADTGSGAYNWLEENQDKYGPYEIKTYDGMGEVQQDVVSGRLDGGLGDSPNMEYFAGDYPEVEMGLYLGEGHKIGIAFRPDYPLVDEFNECLMELKESGKTAELYEEFFGSEPREGGPVVKTYPDGYSVGD